MQQLDVVCKQVLVCDDKGLSRLFLSAKIDSPNMHLLQDASAVWIGALLLGAYCS